MTCPVLAATHPVSPFDVSRRPTSTTETDKWLPLSTVSTNRRQETASRRSSSRHRDALPARWLVDRTRGQRVAFLASECVGPSAGTLQPSSISSGWPTATPWSRLSRNSPASSTIAWPAMCIGTSQTASSSQMMARPSGRSRRRMTPGGQRSRRPAIAARTRLLAAECPRFGYQYCVALAQDLRRQPRLRNACFVLRHGRQPLAFEQREGCRQLLAVVTSFRWVDVVANLYAPLTLAAACHLILEGAMCMDFDKAFDEQFLVVARAAHMETNHE